MHIAALSETRFSEQSQLEEVGAGYTFFWGGHPKAERREPGVAFAIRNDILGRLPCLPQDVNDRLMSLHPRLRSQAPRLLNTKSQSILTCTRRHRTFRARIRVVGHLRKQRDITSETSTSPSTDTPTDATPANPATTTIPVIGDCTADVPPPSATDILGPAPTPASITASSSAKSTIYRALPTDETTSDVPSPTTIIISMSTSSDVCSVSTCPHCDRTFTSHIGFAGHLRIDRLHCPYCARAFIHCMGLFGHMRIHDSGLHYTVSTHLAHPLCLTQSTPCRPARPRRRRPPPPPPPPPPLEPTPQFLSRSPYLLRQSGDEECKSSWNRRRQRQWPLSPVDLLGTPTCPDEHALLPADAEEGHLNASSVATLAPSGLGPRPEARPAGRAGDKSDPECQRIDRPSSRHLQDANSPTIPQEVSNNELAQRLAILPIAAAAASAADENASVDNPWCQLGGTVQSTVLAILGSARCQHRDWFDDNDVANSNLPAEKNRLHKACVTRPTGDKKETFFRSRRLVQQRLREVQDGSQGRGDSSADGSTLPTEKTQILQRCGEHFGSVLNRPSTISDAVIARLPQVETNADVDLPHSLHEIIKAM
ncbi:hypothetical protein SprV_0100200300 [Sparganum proliferum]